MPRSAASASPPPEPKISYRVPSSPVNQLMFSTTPRTDSLRRRAAKAERWATRCAAGCGVVTTMISARGMTSASVNATSPVPGGMSMSTKSGSPQ